MSWINIFFGHGDHLNALQMSCRAALAFFVTLLLLRIAGIRTFGKKTAFDNVIVIMLGSILSRVVVGASPFFATSVACLVFALVHRLLGWLSYRYDMIGWLVKGEKLSLYSQGLANEKNMRQAAISKKDLLEGVRLKINQADMQGIKEIFIERTGELSIVKTDDESH